MLRVGVTPGATPGKWLDRFAERFRRVELVVLPLEAGTERAALDEADADVVFARLPIERDGVHVISLYDEPAVVMFPKDSHLAAADTLTLDDLTDEVQVRPRDDLLGIVPPGAVAPRFDAPATTQEAVATVASGVGFVILPASIARAAQRRDTEVRPLRDGDDHPGTSTVAIVWRPDRENVAELVSTLVGIVRGRTANSSR